MERILWVLRGARAFKVGHCKGLAWAVVAETIGLTNEKELVEVAEMMREGPLALRGALFVRGSCASSGLRLAFRWRGPNGA